MSIFRDRIVLKDGTVIPPDEIYSIELFGTNAVQIELHDGRAYIPLRCDVRTDPPTGVVDSQGKEIFERDVDSKGYTVVWADSGKWMLEKSGDVFPLWDVRKLITITGMVTWEES